jgi:hypothetical protein
MPLQLLEISLKTQLGSAIGNRQLAMIWLWRKGSNLRMAALTMRCLTTWLRHKNTKMKGDFTQIVAHALVWPRGKGSAATGIRTGSGSDRVASNPRWPFGTFATNGSIRQGRPLSSLIPHPSSLRPHPCIGAEGEIRTLEASLEDSHVSSYITSAKIWNS